MVKLYNKTKPSVMVLMFTLGCPICSTRRFLTDNSNLGIVPIIPCVTRKTKGYNDILFRINNKIDLLNFSIRVRIFVMYGRKTFTLNFGFDKIYLEDRVCMELLFIIFSFNQLDLQNKVAIQVLCVPI